MMSENSLHSQIFQLGFVLPAQSPSISISEADLQAIVEHLTPLYEKSIVKKPNLTTPERLLGLFSYHHQVVLGEFIEQREALQKMQNVFKQHLDVDHQDKFSAPILKQLWLATHLWLFLQGRMNLDYSLANDHATQVANHITSIVEVDSNKLRCELTQTYYQGVSIYQATETKKPLWKKWFEKVLN
ncbi:hypothetical protein [Vibrio agarivorans]|uniref:hypothetical protein n=1 Tax=Vibrio agarivorans TaxID=153622 RepID=UPI00222E4C00|nr:hypothetical protein [Vibrio agarivorans]MDN3663048.1 hypothetical protein [Vibrio agarivorans]